MDNVINNESLKMNHDHSNGVKTSGEKISYWVNSIDPIMFSELQNDLETDVVIIGGGIAGISIAYTLSKQGKKVVLLEDGWIGSGETGRTTAHLVNALDDRYFDIEKYHGEDGAKLAAQSHTEAINYIEKIIRSENIDCDFERVNGYLFLDSTDTYESLQKEYDATKRAGLNTAIIQEVPGITNETRPCLVFPDQAQFHPLKYLEGLCDIIIKNGGKIYTKTHVEKVEKDSVTTRFGHKVKAKHIVVATNTPINNTVVMHTKQAAYRTYVIGAKIPKDSLPKALWWDTGNQESEWPTYPYHYVRVHNYNSKYDLLICGGEDHKTGQEDDEIIDRFKLLKDWTKLRFPMMGDIVYRWSGQVMEPVDSLAFIGKNPMDSDNIYIVTGDSGNGMTHGTIAGILIPDLINGKENAWTKLYDPSRITLGTADTFLQENTNAMKHFTEYFTGSDIDSLNDLKTEQGAIIRNGLSKIAVYKDEYGNVHAYSAVCPHLKCIVHWNGEEKTFDCPCHGSRFSCEGKVINGPANTDLEKVNIESRKSESQKEYN